MLSTISSLFLGLLSLSVAVRAFPSSARATNQSQVYLDAISSKPNADQDCKCFPGDSCWPTPLEWQLFNETLGGKLVPTTPLATVCHDPTYDATACDALETAWYLPETQ